jgi:toxin ParE1/3/4
MIAVRFSKEAHDDILRIHDYIAKENPSAAASVIAAIEQSTERLADFPLSGRTGAVEGTRELVLQRLPFIVVYRVTELVEIIAVFHAAQNIPRGF